MKTKVEGFVNSLSNLYLESEHYSKLDKIKQEFSEGYGRNVEVPLKEIIDPNKFDGLSLIETKLKAVSEREKKIRKVVDDKIVSALINDQEEVAKIYQDLGFVMNQHPSWSTYILTAYKNFEKEYGKKATKKRKLFNGFIRTDYYQYFGKKIRK